MYSRTDYKNFDYPNPQIFDNDESENMGVVKELLSRACVYVGGIW